MKSRIILYINFLIIFIFYNLSYSAGIANNKNNVGKQLGIKFIPGSYNKPMPSRKITHIVIHATGGPSADPEWHFKGHDLPWVVDLFTKHRRVASSHYVIGKDGEIVQLVKDQNIAFHAKGFNQNSIGIELVNNGDGIDPFPDAEIISLIKLAVAFKNTYKLSAASFVSHEEVDKLHYADVFTHACDGKTYARKIDPGPLFPWDKLRKALQDN